MKTARVGMSIGVVACLVVLVGVFASTSKPSNAQSSCAGKPYPSPNCPNLRPPQTSQERALCGNEVLDGKEECDDGPANGTNDSSCSSSCHLRYCGDGILQSYLNEQCEPVAQEFYALSGTGLVIERQFTAKACGSNYCAPPNCDEDGNCDGGCVMQNLPACTVSSSSSSSSTKSKKSSAASVASATTSSAMSSAVSSAAVSSTALSLGISSASTASILPPVAASSASSAAAASSATSKTSSAAASASSSSAAVVIAQPGIGLSVSLDGPLVTQRGQVTTYRVIVKNNTAKVVKNVVVNDYLINYGSLESFTLDANAGGTGTCQLTGISIRCSGFDLNANEARSLRFTFQFLPIANCQPRQKADAYATVNGDINDPFPDDNETDLFTTLILCNQRAVSSQPAIPPYSASSLGTASSFTLEKSSASSVAVLGASSLSSAAQSSTAISSSASVTSENSSFMKPFSQGSMGMVVGICGDGKENPGEECDFGPANGSEGSVCDTKCHRLVPGPPVEDGESLRILGLRISYGLLIALVPGYLFVSRRRWMKLFKDIDDEDLPDPKRKSIDDVPLDEIEMPWRKF